MNKLFYLKDHKEFITCFDCNKTYLPMSSKTEFICPFCQGDLLLSDELELVYEEVSHDEINEHWDYN